MSEELNQQEESKNKVVITPEDVLNIKKYCEHFNVPSTPALLSAIDAFAAEPTFENQKLFKLRFCEWIVLGNHPSFKDEIWNVPRSRAEQAMYDLQFEMDVNDVLSQKEANSKTE